MQNTAGQTSRKPIYLIPVGLEKNRALFSQKKLTQMFSHLRPSECHVQMVEVSDIQ